MAGRIQQARFGHSAISFRSQTIIVGGRRFSDEFGAPLITEIWVLDEKNTTTIEPNLPDNRYTDGTALFLVEDGYCKKTKS